jgi:hypothetical protein
MRAEQERAGPKSVVARGQRQAVSGVRSASLHRLRLRQAKAGCQGDGGVTRVRRRASVSKGMSAVGRQFEGNRPGCALEQVRTCVVSSVLISIYRGFYTSSQERRGERERRNVGLVGDEGLGDRSPPLVMSSALSEGQVPSDGSRAEGTRSRDISQPLSTAEDCHGPAGLAVTKGPEDCHGFRTRVIARLRSSRGNLPVRWSKQAPRSRHCARSASSQVPSDGSRISDAQPDPSSASRVTDGCASAGGRRGLVVFFGGCGVV